jgi:methylmalonyl-CoA mutase N-terminal domain/subunit
VQEVAFTLANAIAYIESGIAAGLEVDAFAPRLSFFFNAHNDFLEEIAKFRAARRLYARLMKERFGAKDPRSMMLRFHTQTAGSTLSAQQADVNLVRVAVQAMAGVLGGTQSLHTNSRDEALGLPSEESVRLALRTQQIIAHETGVTNTADPLGGSYWIEELTDRIERDAAAYIERIDAMGGTLRAIEEGFIQGEIQAAAYDYQRRVETGQQVVVGVNRFRAGETQSFAAFRNDPGSERAQVERLREVRSSRSDTVVRERLGALEQAARGTENVVPPILECCAALGTLGEISDTLRAVFGEWPGRA